jgi:hypothetical protein
VHGVADHIVVNGERKRATEQSVCVEDAAVDARVEGQRINVGEKGIEEIAAQSGLLLFVERVAVGEIGQGGGPNADVHRRRSRSWRLASAQSSEGSLPSAMR